jgi:hypothetical protein
MRWFKKNETDPEPDATENAHRFKARKMLLNPAEQAFLEVMDNHLDPQYRVFSKVAPACIVDVPLDGPDSQRRLLLQEMNAYPLDFVICDADACKILGVIMLEDMPEDESGRRVFDSFIDRLMASAGIPVVHIPAKARYSAPEIKIEIARSLFVKWKPTQKKPAEPSAENSSAGAAREPSAGLANGNAFGNCPLCGSAYVKRQATSGKYAGKFFLACANYPRCKNLRLLKAPSPSVRNPND